MIRTIKLALVRLLACLGCIVILVTFTPVDYYWTKLLGGRHYETSGSVLIVLSDSNIAGEFMGQGSYIRAVYAVRAYRTGNYRRIIISGGSKPGTPVASLMRDYMVASNVPRELVTVEADSASTRDSAQNLRSLLLGLPSAATLLTSDYHMFRASRTFAKQGVRVLPQPIPDAEKRSTRWYLRWPVFVELLIETVKIGYYWGRGWI